MHFTVVEQLLASHNIVISQRQVIFANIANINVILTC